MRKMYVLHIGLSEGKSGCMKWLELTFNIQQRKGDFQAVPPPPPPPPLLALNELVCSVMPLVGKC